MESSAVSSVALFGGRFGDHQALVALRVSHGDAERGVRVRHGDGERGVGMTHL